MNVRIVGVVLAGLAGLAGVAGCTGRAAPTPSSSGAQSPGPATTAPTTVSAVTDCGAFELSQGERLPAAAVACLRAAIRDRRPARLEQTAPTVEGDPIHLTYVSDPDGRVAVTTDARQDRYGSGTIERATCTGLLPGEGWIEFAKCID